MAPRLRPFLVLLTAAAAPGCAAPAAEREGAALREALASSRASLAVLGQSAPPQGARAGEPDAERAPPPAGRPASPPAVPVTAATAGAPPGSAAELLGLGPEALRRALGEPELRRPEGTAEVWLYTAEACALDLVLYQDRGGRLRVAHAAARASGAEPRTEAACLREIAAPAPAAPGPRAAATGGGAA